MVQQGECKKVDLKDKQITTLTTRIKFLGGKRGGGGLVVLRSKSTRLYEMHRVH